MDVNQALSQERRMFTRLPQKYILQYSEITFPPEEENIAVEARDISASGLLFHSEKNIPLGILLNLELKLIGWDKYKTEFIKPDEWSSLSKPLTVIGKVVRVEEVLSNKIFEIGISFVNIDQGDKGALLRFLDKL